MSADLTKRQAT